MKQEPTIQLCVKVPSHTAEQIKKLAAANNIGIAEQLRQFIEKGLAVEGYSQNIDFIASIIRQELMAVYHLEDIKAVVEQQTNRIAKMHMKSGKIDAAAFFPAY